ncbi:MAG: phosphopantetheine-binding protein [Bacteroidales bacterium]|jgi:acyl carrier protein|nr:phosphopantetheine-binding protein [Bacteroidales bacterium]
MIHDDVIEKILDNLKKFDINIADLEADFITENNIDSITFIEIIINLEEEFSILIPEEYLLIERMNTVSKIAEVIKKELISANSEFKEIS